MPLLLRGSAPARIVNVASAGQSPIYFDDPMLERRCDRMRAYAQSKLTLVMFTFDLAEELEGTGVTVTCLHPATLMDTKMVFEAFGRASSSVQEGADATVYLVTSPELEGVTGKYFDGRSEARREAGLRTRSPRSAQALLGGADRVERARYGLVGPARRVFRALDD